MKKIQFEEQGTKVVCPMDCDNAPKKRVLKEFITDFPNGKAHAGAIAPPLGMG